MPSRRGGGPAVRREHLAHLLRAAARIVDRDELLVVGSQSILGTWDEDELPEAAIVSMEADLAVFDDPGSALADRISGSLGELSPFDVAFGYHADGVDGRVPAADRARLRARISALTGPTDRR